MKTLLVEDDPLSLLVLEKQIKIYGYEVMACERALNALERYQHTFYPLIVTDLNLPGMDGLELCRRIRALPQGKQSMILVVTGRDTPEDLQAVLDAGADDYLTKPISQEMLNIRLTIMEQRLYQMEQRKRAEQEWENLIALIEHSADFIVMASLDGQVRYVNKAGQQLVGLNSLAEAKTTRMDDYAPEAELPKMEQAIAAVMRDGVWRGEGDFKHFHTQARIPVEINLFTIKDQETGQPSGLAAVIRDITQRKQAEAKHLQLEAQLRQSQRLEALGILAGGIAHDFNNILGTMLGYTELLLAECVENRKAHEYLEQVSRAGERATDLVQQILTFSRAAEHVLKPTAIAPIIEEALKMLRATIPANVVFHQHLPSHRRPILADATQIHQVLVNLCANAAYAMRGRGGILAVALAEVRYDPEQGWLSTSSAPPFLAGPGFNDPVSSKTTDSPPGRGRGGLLGERQVLSAKNPPLPLPGGEFTAASCKSPDLSGLGEGAGQMVLLDLPAGAYLRLTVSDTGCGMTPDVREHIFEPFFTTKAIGEGSGLGLSVVHGIVKGHRGVITVESEPGQGTVFQIFFPLPSQLEVPGLPPETNVLRKGREHILIVEDEPALARLYEIALTKLGYQVTTCTDSVEALQTFQATPDRFDVVFTDQTMPNLTGVQLSQELLRMRPDLPIILATGYSDAISEKDALALGIRQFLKKPVKFSVLTQTIRQIFERRNA